MSLTTLKSCLFCKAENSSTHVSDKVQGGVVIRSDTKPPGDLITTHFRGNLKIVGPYSPTFPAPKKIVRPYKHPVSGVKKESETL